DDAGKLSLKMPGQGQCDFGALGAAMVDKGYRGPAFIEVYSDMYRDLEELKSSFAFMNKTLSAL
ncbi:MAG: hypothetical protein IJH54_01935, partial [Clostridia bacterium]|nr:hypothetical protein [Clostridia bacterium]